MVTQEINVPIDVSDEWGVVFDSPFSLAAEDLCRFHFFSCWLSTGEVPSFAEVHSLVHDNEWFNDLGHTCPGPERLHLVYSHCKEMFS